ncbi:MAG: COP23 domain-containing protein [Thermosynechococcaceae cyanobacterium MS004]|nr:COP23 domain-containing protein [Thermosynechococcaceae cyanobacterium MS004]
MKASLFKTLAIATTFGTLAISPLLQPQPAAAQFTGQPIGQSIGQSTGQSTAKFFCREYRNPKTGELVPATFASTKRGSVPMILWKSTFFSNGANSFSPINRCIEVSRRFQTFYSEGVLTYLTTGQMNNQNVICVADEYGGPCRGLLLTLEPKDNPTQFLRDLTNLRTRASGPITRGSESLYIDVDEMLEAEPTEAPPLTVTP